MRLGALILLGFLLGGCMVETGSRLDPVPQRPVAEVFEVQTLLSNLGFQPGPIDGKMGKRTERALAAYRASRGLPENGGIDSAVTMSLRVESAASPGTPATEPQMISKRWLPEQIREAIDPDWDDYAAMLIDLDKDGDLDLVSLADNTTGLCEDTLCPMVVIEQLEIGWRRAGESNATNIRLRRSVHNGWRDLAAVRALGAPILRYDGQFYR